METGYCLLITIFLLSLLSTRGFTLTCGAYNERPSSTDIEKCIRLEKAFENALLNNESNLYILRTAFLSSSCKSITTRAQCELQFQGCNLCYSFVEQLTSLRSYRSNYSSQLTVWNYGIYLPFEWNFVLPNYLPLFEFSREI